MAAKFMRIKKIVISTFVVAMMMMQATGCSIASVTDLSEMLDNNEVIEIEIAIPVDSIEEKNSVGEWTELAELKTFKTLRSEFDRIVGVTPIVITDTKELSKSGTIYVNGITGDHDGNSTLEWGIRNGKFVSEIWGSAAKKELLAKISGDTFLDTAGKDINDRLASVIDSYYNLFGGSDDTDNYNGNAVVGRDELMSAVYKASNPVSNNHIDTAQAFNNLIGGRTDNSDLASMINQFALLSTKDRSLTVDNIVQPISRIEAAYIIVQMHFPDEIGKVDIKEDKAYSDMVNGGNFLKKFKFEESNGELKSMASSALLMQMMRNYGKGTNEIDENVYKSMVVAKKYNLLGADLNGSKWGQAITKSEAVIMITKAFEGKNTAYGYMQNTAVGNMPEFEYNRTDTVVDLGNDEKKEEEPIDSDGIGVFVVEEEEEVEVERASVDEIVEEIYVRDLEEEKEDAIEVPEEVIEEVGISIQFIDLNKNMYIIGSPVNVRESYSTESKRLGRLMYGAEVKVTGVCEEIGWHRVEYNDETAYIVSNLLSDTKPAEAEPEKADYNQVSEIGVNGNGDAVIVVDGDEYAPQEKPPAVSSGTDFGPNVTKEFLEKNGEHIVRQIKEKYGEDAIMRHEYGDGIVDPPYKVGYDVISDPDGFTIAEGNPNDGW